MKRWLITALSGVLIGLLTSIALAQGPDSYDRWFQLAEQARRRGDFETALQNYGRANRERPNDPAINQGVSELLEERLQRLEKTFPKYVAHIRKADRAYFDGDYPLAILNYRRALRDRPNDYYAKVRIRQAVCIQTKQPATGSQFMTLCPSLFPD
ncbi:MAG: hypothetical protein SFW36_20330 [Leptolyngbyaceae cyanobacterium bins.59]|nr:hypothetical protein [Leptolyngbyaceae cyanobacterium bins.59]